VFEEPQGLYCGKQHPLFDQREPITVETLEQCAYAGRSYMQDWTPPADIQFKSHAIASHMEGIALMILSGEMVGYLPQHFAKQWVEAGLMQIILPDSLSYSEQFYLACRKSERNRTALAFFDCLRQRLTNKESTRGLV
jgi:DNA-binding transcriptional LysR family regulator